MHGLRKGLQTTGSSVSCNFWLRECFQNNIPSLSLQVLYLHSRFFQFYIDLLTCKTSVILYWVSEHLGNEIMNIFQVHKNYHVVRSCATIYHLYHCVMYFFTFKLDELTLNKLKTEPNMEVYFLFFC